MYLYHVLFIAINICGIDCKKTVTYPFGKVNMLLHCSQRVGRYVRGEL
jgi:hypothetical protein